MQKYPSLPASLFPFSDKKAAKIYKKLKKPYDLSSIFAGNAKKHLPEFPIPETAMDIRTSIHIEPSAYTGPKIQKGETSPGKTQPAAPVSPQPESASREEGKTASSSGAVRLTPAQLRMVSELKSRDQEVRAHEQAHVASGGGHVNGGIRYSYQKGPDGRMYAIGGEVSIDVSPVPGDPEATAQKMEQVRRAALAPADPSPQDRRVAAKATLVRSEALQEIALMQMEARREPSDAADSHASSPYTRAPRITGSLFHIQA
jgi:hypothetical protein